MWHKPWEWGIEWDSNFHMNVCCKPLLHSSNLLIFFFYFDVEQTVTMGYSMRLELTHECLLQTITPLEVANQLRQMYFIIHFSCGHLWYVYSDQLKFPPPPNVILLIDCVMKMLVI